MAPISALAFASRIGEPIAGNSAARTASDGLSDGEAKLMIVLHSARGRSISLASLDLARAGRFCIEAPPQPLRIDRTTDALVTVGCGPT